MSVKPLISIAPYIQQMTHQKTHNPLQMPPEIKGLLKSKENESYSLFVTLEEEAKTIAKSGLEIEQYVALRVHKIIHGLREAGQICIKPIAYVTTDFPLFNTSFEGVFIKLHDIRKKEKKKNKDQVRVYNTICIVADKQMILYNNFELLKKINNIGYFFRLLRGDPCGQLVGNGETEKTKWIGRHVRRSTVSIQRDTPPTTRTEMGPSYRFLVNKQKECFRVADPSDAAHLNEKEVQNPAIRRPMEVHKLTITADILQLLKPWHDKQYSLFVTFEGVKVGKKDALTVALKVDQVIVCLKKSGQISERPIAQVTASFPEASVIYNGVWIKLHDVRKKGGTHRALCLVSDKQMLLFNNKIHFKMINNNGYIARLLKKEGCGQLIGGMETQKMKKRNGRVQPTVSIEEGIDLSKEAGQKESYHFLVTKENRIKRDHRSIDNEEKQAEKETDFDV